MIPFVAGNIIATMFERRSHATDLLTSIESSTSFLAVLAGNPSSSHFMMRIVQFMSFEMIYLAFMIVLCDLCTVIWSAGVAV